MAFTLIDLAGGAGGAGDINVNIALQEKTVDSSTETQHVVPTDGYIGIKDVIVNPYVLDSSNAVITDNGEYVFESAADGLGPGPESGDYKVVQTADESGADQGFGAVPTFLSADQHLSGGGSFRERVFAVHLLDEILTERYQEEDSQTASQKGR